MEANFAATKAKLAAAEARLAAAEASERGPRVGLPPATFVFFQDNSEEYPPMNEWPKRHMSTTIVPSLAQLAELPPRSTVFYIVAQTARFTSTNLQQDMLNQVRAKAKSGRRA